jgi:basic membrane protein A and related proteins
MRRNLTLFLLAILLLPLIAACGQQTTTTGATTTAGETQPSAVPTVPVPTEAGAEEETAMAETMEPSETMEAETPMAEETAMAEETTMAETATMEETTMAETATSSAGGSGSATGLKIGMVTDIGKLGDKSFNDSAWAGVEAGAEAVGGEARVIETVDPNDYERNIGQFIAEDYDVIVTVGFGLGEQTITAAQANPDIHFIGVDQFQAETIPNLTGLVFEEDKAGFLVGALAALYSKSGSIGAVLGTDAVPPVWRFGEGYRAGALHVKPDINIQTVYHSDVGFDKTFSDPEWGRATALSMIDQGVDVVFGAGGATGNGALFAAADRASEGVVAIGVDADQYETVPEARSVMLSSAIKIIDQGVTDLIQQVADGTIQGGNFNGEVGIAPFHELEDQVSDEIKARIEELRTQLEDGTLKTNVAPAKPS